MLDPDTLAALRSVLGPAGVVTEPADLRAYEIGARSDEGRAAVVLRPATVETLSATVGLCVRAGLPLVPQSGNTGVVAGSTPDGSGTQAVLSLDRMVSPFTLDLDNRSVRVGAGLRLSQLAEKLEPHGLMFPIELGADPRIGGMVSTNTGGARFLRYGDVRRNVLGLKVVLADQHGTVLDLGGDLRKNNTGVDWKQVFIGTAGSFGVIAECVLNLERAPRQVATVLLVPAGDAAVMPLLRSMEERLGTYLTAFEGMSGHAIRAALRHVPTVRNPFGRGAVPDYVVLAEVSRSWNQREGEASLDAVLEAAVAEVWDSHPDLLADALFGPSAETWKLRHALSEGVRHAGKLIAFDLSFRRGDVLAFRARMVRELSETMPEVTICDFGHVGDGGVHFNLVVDPASARAADPRFEATLRDRVYQVAVEGFGGSFSGEHGLGRRNESYYAKYTPHELRRLAGDLKRSLSPGRIGSIGFGPEQ